MPSGSTTAADPLYPSTSALTIGDPTSAAENATFPYPAAPRNFAASSGFLTTYTSESGRFSAALPIHSGGA